MKKKIIIALIIIGVLLIAGGITTYVILHIHGKAVEDYGYEEGMYEEGAYPEEYDIAGEGFTDYGMNNLYTGVVEAQQSLDIQKDNTREIDEIYVEAGDEVSEGTPLFSYKVDDVSLKIEQANIELEGIQNDIVEAYARMDFLSKELAKLDVNKEEDKERISECQMEYLEIQSSIRQSEMSAKSKQAEINSLQKSVDNAVVLSSIDGIVKNISAGTGNTEPFISIMGTGNYRIKCRVDEMNIYSLQEGMQVIIRSRVDDKTWKGTITKIETGELAKDENEDTGYYGSGGDTVSESASDYYFYVTPEEEGLLLLGQHVYVEVEAGDMTDMYDEAGEGEDIYGEDRTGEGEDMYSEDEAGDGMETEDAP